jgi:triosephosphate isomerase
MQTPIIIANLKCNPSNIKELFKLQDSVWNKLNKEKYKYYLATPNIFLRELTKEKYKAFEIGTQNIDRIESGAYTGEISLPQALDAEAKFCILGHSEVRARGETSLEISKKVNETLRANLPTVLCVGEKSRTLETYLDEIKNMLVSSLQNIDRRYVESLVIAYEPLWAIGASRAATVDDCLEATIQIRRTLVDLFGISNAKKIKVLYGGSVDEINAASFIRLGGVDGVLVGRASLDADKFATIVNSIYEV